MLAAALAVAGVIHCLLTPEHMAMSAIFGVGFLAAGIAQFGMAALSVVRPSRLLYAAVIASTVVRSTTYAYNVTVGLPLREDVTTAMAVGGEADDESHGESEGTAGHAEGGHEDDAPATTDHHDAGVVPGAGEGVDAYGAFTQLAQLSAAGVALVLLRRPTRSATE